MIAIFKKEFYSFFTSTIAYLIIGVFLFVNGLVLWVFKGDYNILNAGFADINSFFFIAPWVFLFLIPAITMKSFAEEFSTGTIEILQTKPISNTNIVLGKFLAALFLIFLALLPTLTYVFSIFNLANPKGSIDFGGITGSYFGLLFLASAYIAIGLFTSTLSKNQIIAFVLATFITLFFYYGLETIANSIDSLAITKMGMYSHYKSISRGVIDTRDLIYFVSITFLFLYLTKMRLENE